MDKVFLLILCITLQLSCRSQSTNSTADKFLSENCKKDGLNNLLQRFSQKAIPLVRETYFMYVYEDRIEKNFLDSLLILKPSKGYVFNPGIMIRYNGFYLLSVLKTNIENDLTSSELLVTLDTCGNKISEILIGIPADKVLVKYSINNNKVVSKEAHLLYKGILRGDTVEAAVLTKEYNILTNGVIEFKKEYHSEKKVLKRNLEFNEFMIED